MIESLLISQHAAGGDLDRLPTGIHFIDMMEDDTEKELRVLKWEEVLQPILQMTSVQQLSQVIWTEHRGGWGGRSEGGTGEGGEGTRLKAAPATCDSLIFDIIHIILAYP